MKKIMEKSLPGCVDRAENCERKALNGGSHCDANPNSEDFFSTVFVEAKRLSVFLWIAA